MGGINLYTTVWNTNNKFANMTVNINNLTIPSEQVAYYYVGSNDTPLTTIESRGKVYIDGVLTQLPYLEG